MLLRFLGQWAAIELDAELFTAVFDCRRIGNRPRHEEFADLSFKQRRQGQS